MSVSYTIYQWKEYEKTDHVIPPRLQSIIKVCVFGSESEKVSKRSTKINRNLIDKQEFPSDLEILVIYSDRSPRLFGRVKDGPWVNITPTE